MIRVKEGGPGDTMTDAELLENLKKAYLKMPDKGGNLRYPNKKGALKLQIIHLHNLVEKENGRLRRR